VIRSGSGSIRLHHHRPLRRCRRSSRPARSSSLSMRKRRKNTMYRRIAVIFRSLRSLLITQHLLIGLTRCSTASSHRYKSTAILITLLAVIWYTVLFRQDRTDRPVDTGVESILSLVHCMSAKDTLYSTANASHAHFLLPHISLNITLSATFVSAKAEEHSHQSISKSYHVVARRLALVKIEGAAWGQD